MPIRFVLSLSWQTTVFMKHLPFPQTTRVSVTQFKCTQVRLTATSRQRPRTTKWCEKNAPFDAPSSDEKQRFTKTGSGHTPFKSRNNGGVSAGHEQFKLLQRQFRPVRLPLQYLPRLGRYFAIVAEHASEPGCGKRISFGSPFILAKHDPSFCQDRLGTKHRESTQMRCVFRSLHSAVSRGWRGARTLSSGMTHARPFFSRCVAM